MSMSFEGPRGGKESVQDQYRESHKKASEYLGAAYDEAKVDAIAAVRGWDVVLTELAALPEEADPAAWYTDQENAECLEMFGK